MQFHLFFICCQTAGLVFELRQKWQSLFIKRIRCPSKPWSQQDEAVIRTLVSVCYVSSSSSFSSSFSSPSSSFFKVSLASQEEIMYQLWIWIMTRTHTIPQPLYPTSIFANIKSNVENCEPISNWSPSGAHSRGASGRPAAAYRDWPAAPAHVIRGGTSWFCEELQEQPSTTHKHNEWQVLSSLKHRNMYIAMWFIVGFHLLTGLPVSSVMIPVKGQKRTNINSFL